MEESDELLSDGAVGHSVPLESFETERNANDPKLKSGEIKQQDDGLCNNEERLREITNRPEEELVENLEECQSDENEATEKVIGSVKCGVFSAICKDDIERLREIIEKGPASASRIACGYMPIAPFWSLNCFEYLCDAYEQLTDSSRTQVAWDFGSPLITIVEGCNWAAIRIAEKHADFMNYFVDEPSDDNGYTPMLIAVHENYVEVAKWLINKPGKKPDIEKRNRQGESPIYLAALKGQAEVIKEMLEIYSCSQERRESLLTNETLYGKGHSIFYPASQSRKPTILDFLMEDERAPLLLQRELQHSESEKFILGSCLSGSEKLLKAMLELDKDLPIGRLKDEEGVTSLMRVAEAGRLETVKIMIRSKSGKDAISMCDNNGRNVFHYAVKYPEILEHLLTVNQNTKAINKLDAKYFTPLKLAAVGGLIESFKLLLGYISSDKDVFGYPAYVAYTNVEVLRIAVEEWELRDKVAVSDFLYGRYLILRPLMEMTGKGDIEMMQFILEKRANGNQTDGPCPNDGEALRHAVWRNSLNCVELLIEKIPGLIDDTDDEMVSAAGTAFFYGNVEILKFLLKNGAKATSEANVRKNILKCSGEETTEETIEEVINFCVEHNLLEELMKDADADPDFNVMSWLVKFYPSVAVKVLDQCIVFKRCSIEHLAYKVFPLMPKATDTAGKLEAIESMVTYRRDECLGHPVVLKFLNKKLNSTSVRLWIMGNILLYMIFLVSLTTYTGMQTIGSYSLKSTGLYALSFITLAFGTINIIKEILQVKFNGKEYFHHFDNYMEWTTYICAIVYVIQSGQKKSSFQIASGAIAVFFSWINFIWFMKSFSLFGIHVIMAKKVFLSICKVLPMVVLFIVAFAMAFSVLMSHDQGFTTIPNSLLTTFVMMTGEVDFRDTFLGYAGSAGFHFLQRLLLVVFLILVTIGITNLLTGLAVGDTAEIMKRSREENLLRKANLVITLERTLHDFPWFSPPTVDKEIKIKLKDQDARHWLTKLWEAVYEEVDEVVTNVSEKKEDRSKKIEEKLNALSEKYEIREKNTQEQLKHLLKHRKKIEEQLSKIQTMLEMMETNVGAAVNQRKDTRE